MTLAASKDAIGEVTDLLRTRIAARAMVNVDVGRPESATVNAGPKLNLFLFQLELDPHLKNHPLDEGQVPPLWMVLRYLLTAFDADKESDSVAAHRILGQGLAALQELNYLESSVPALSSNPEPLKITFDAADVELLSKIMQGSDESYRISAAFQVRPVLIMPDSSPSYALPVKTVGPPAAPGAFVMPDIGARLSELRPERFEAGAALSLRGEGVNGSIDQVWVGPAAFPVNAAREGEVRATVPLDTVLSPGSYPVSVSRTLPSGRVLRSDAVIGTLVPTLTGFTLGALTPNAGNLFGDVTLSGRRLGGPDDAIFVAFYRDGVVSLMLEAAGIAAQTSVLAQVDAAHALAPGDYRLILRVNGAQASEVLEVHWV
jgi:Pvc16 N-terminal domain